MHEPSTPNPPVQPSSITNTGFFHHAQGLTVTGGQFIDASNVDQSKTYYITNVIERRDAVFELLAPYACLDATKDSSARYPPPRCHDKTRLKIRDRLMRWLVDEYDDWKMLWVRGSVGIGKSAVAQSFGESCEEEDILEGSYFFSRAAGRNRLETVVPTLVYQFARNFPEYHSLIQRRLARDQLLLRSSPPVQFRKLITEPFATLQRQDRRNPIVIILDGLDECESEDAQREILEMITNAIRTHPNLPLRWLILSRPEAHLKNAFVRIPECGREELIVDAECRENVERYVKDRFSKIRGMYNDILPANWPSGNQLQDLLDAVSGLFAFALTCLNYIGDSKEADPRSQLDFLLTFIRRSQGVVTRNPLAALDLLYSRILEDIPPHVFQTTRKILEFVSYQNIIDRSRHLKSAQGLSNFLRLDQHAFYKAVRGLHSVMYIPDSEDAAKSRLTFYHASFLDFLLDPHRSGKFVVSRQEALADVVRSGVYWYEIDVTNFHTHDGWNYDHNHKHDSLPGLTWASEDNRSPLSQSIINFVENSLFDQKLDMQLDGVVEDLLSQISNLDFRYWLASNVFLLVHLCRLDPSTPVVRIEPTGPMDHQLLEHFHLATGNGVDSPAVFPLRRPLPLDRWTREYFFIGHGVKSVILSRAQAPPLNLAFPYSFRCDQEPHARIPYYQLHLEAIRWDEEKAKLG